MARAARDLPVLEAFVTVWCDGHHQGRLRAPFQPPAVVANQFQVPRPRVCGECATTLAYSIGRRLLCPQDPKPACKKCPTPCYRDDHRERMRRIMRYSGIRLILKGRLSWIRKYFW